MADIRHIPGHPNYQVDDCGNVYSTKSGQMVKLKPGKTAGYPMFVSNQPSGRSSVYVHRAMLESFVGPCPGGMECCHHDGDRTNNRIANLRWDTHRENIRDTDRHGRLPRGQRAGSSKLNPLQVRIIRSCCQLHGMKQKDVARVFGLHQVTVSNIVMRKIWTHI